MYLRQSTAQTIRFGPCLDITDGVTEETALTLAQADMRLSKDGAAFAQKSAAGNATHDSDGWYSTSLSTTDTNTVGELILNVHQPANMLPVWMRFYVVEEAVYDAFFAASSAGIPSIPANWITAAGINADAITAAKVAADVHAEAADAVWDELQSAHVTAGSFGEVATEVASILVDTAEIGTAGAGLTNINLPDQTMNITGNLSGSVGSVTGAVGSVTGAVGSVTAGVTLDATAVDAIWDETMTAHVTADSAAVAVKDILADTNELQTDDIPGTLATLATSAALATVDTNVDNLNLGIIYGTAQTGTLSTTQATTDLTGYADSELIGRVIIFTGGTADGQASRITAYANASGLVTFQAITTAPVNADPFKIV